MKFLAHRGFWKTPHEKNTLAAFDRAFSQGLGVELDVRDIDGLLVISHDLPRAGDLTFAAVLDRYIERQAKGTIAINIKADGLAPYIEQLLDWHGMLDSCFVFDMSVPDLLAYNASRIHTFTRYSEYETIPSRLDLCEGVWVDTFENDRADEEKMVEYLTKGKRVVMVSPELHGKLHREAWAAWQSALSRAALNDKLRNRLLLCTDLPEEAKSFFSSEML
jgi:hypothetical protein